jgi:hypothetical protein
MGCPLAAFFRPRSVRMCLPGAAACARSQAVFPGQHTVPGLAWATYICAGLCLESRNQNRKVLHYQLLFGAEDTPQLFVSLGMPFLLFSMAAQLS